MAQSEEWHNVMDSAVELAQKILNDPAYDQSYHALGLSYKVQWLAEHFGDRP